MTAMNLLLVEDSEQDQKTCQNAVNDFQEDNECEINLEIKATVQDAIDALNNSYYDGAIIDMKLAGEGNEGNLVIDQIRSTFRRIPVVIFTGTPDVAELDNFPLLDLKKKGETQYSDIINNFWGLYKTGLTRIMGGQGHIEQSLSQIFIKNLLPQRSRWIDYGKEDSEKTEKAFLRHALNHLIQILDIDVATCYPEEFYIYPAISAKVNTGCIVKSKHSGGFYVVMNPACDLALRNDGGCNTDMALLAKIDSQHEFLEAELIKKQRKKPEIVELTKKDKENSIKPTRQNKTAYYHWLPETEFFSGGFINFRKISTYSEDELEEQFEHHTKQISSPFLKDIVARFSSYYARQGQPDIDHERIEINLE